MFFSCTPAPSHPFTPCPWYHHTLVCSLALAPSHFHAPHALMPLRLCSWTLAPSCPCILRPLCSCTLVLTFPYTLVLSWPCTLMPLCFPTIVLLHCCSHPCTLMPLCSCNLALFMPLCFSCLCAPALLAPQWATWWNFLYLIYYIELAREFGIFCLSIL